MSKEKLKKYVSEYGTDFSTDGNVLYCKMCKIKIKFEKKYNVSQHIKTESTKKMLNEKMNKLREESNNF